MAHRTKKGSQPLGRIIAGALALTLAVPALADATDLVLSIAMPAWDDEPMPGYRTMTLGGTGQRYLVSETSLMRIVKSSIVDAEFREPHDGHAAIVITLSAEAASTLHQVTSANVARYVAVTLGDVLVMVPMLKTPISGGVLILSLGRRPDLPTLLGELATVLPGGLDGHDFAALRSEGKLSVRIGDSPESRAMPAFSRSSRGAVAIDVEVEGFASDGTVEVVVTQPSGSPLASASSSHELQATTTSFRIQRTIDLPQVGLAVGRYELTAAVRDASGAVLARRSAAFLVNE